MDQFRAQVEEILVKPVIDENDMAILRARESYLTDEEKKQVGLVKVEKTPKVSKKK